MASRALGLPIAVLVFASCSLIPAAMAGAGAGLGSLVGGPGGAVAGGALGSAGGELLEGDVRESDTHVPSVLTHDLVETLIHSKMDEQKGFFDGLLDEVYALIKIAALVFLALVLVPMLYAWHRKKKAQPFYDWANKVRNGE